jgi:hypothetical protein
MFHVPASGFERSNLSYFLGHVLATGAVTGGSLAPGYAVGRVKSSYILLYSWKMTYEVDLLCREIGLYDTKSSSQVSGPKKARAWIYNAVDTGKPLLTWKSNAHILLCTGLGSYA